MTSKNTWALEQLQKFSQADDFRVSPFYSDGKTYGTPTWIWSVVVDHRLFIRAWNGQNSRWYRSAIKQQGGRIFLDGSNHEVIFKSYMMIKLINWLTKAIVISMGRVVISLL
jgi:Uncharacterized protein conserved in bacteria